MPLPLPTIRAVCFDLDGLMFNTEHIFYESAGVLLERRGLSMSREEALSWIRQFRDRHVVIKLGGSAMEATEAVRSFLTDVIFMSSVGMRPILVHGGGKAINAAMTTAGIAPRFVQGRRYTDDATLEIVPPKWSKRCRSRSPI